MQAALAVNVEKNDERARELCRKALSLQADNYPALSSLRLLAKTDVQRKEVDELFNKAIASGTKEANIYLDFANLLQAKGAPANDVAGILEKGIAAQPDSVGLRNAGTRFWMIQGKPEKAISFAQEGFAANPDSPQMESLLASALSATGDHQQAASHYAQLATRFPEQAQLRVRQAEALQRGGQGTQAIDALKKAVVDLPNDMRVHLALASMQLQQGQLDEALVTASILRDRKGWAAQGYLIQGDIQVKAKRYDEAFKSFAAATAEGAGMLALQRRLNLLDKTNDSSKAEKELREWLTAHPEDSAMPVYAAIRATRAGKAAEAVTYYTKLVALNPDDFIQLNDLAWAQLQAGDKSALDTAFKAHALAPDNPQVLDTLGMAQVAAGKRAEGIASLRRALGMAPNNGEFKLHLAEALIANGDTAEARKLMESISDKSLDADSRKRLEALRAKG